MQPAPGTGDHLDRLKSLLREMFQLDRGDLDFGLYRIMNLKSTEIAAFLDDDLLPQVKTRLNLTSAQEREALTKVLENAREQARASGYNPDSNPSPKIVELNRRLAEMKKDADAEGDVYNHLANFFDRYYCEGDFISQRRYSSGGRSAYLIPYDGEEVKLHWANSDQYYIKTTENYASYVFTVGTGDGARRVRFEMAGADNEKDNIKEAEGKQRRFVLADGEGAISVESGDLAVRFEHRPLKEGEKKKWPGNSLKQQDRINEAAAEGVLDAVDPSWQILLASAAPTDADGERTLLKKHIERYTARNSFDYFIHKDLGSYLRRELDLYLNTEVLNLNDLEQGDTTRLDRALARVRATRHIGGKIIDFLAQLEEFQKQLWLKKKFVLETQYCVTLDRVPEDMYPEIAANTAQCDEWVELFAADMIGGGRANGGLSWSNPPSTEFLKANPCLVLDSRHFGSEFADRLLTVLSDAGPLDEQLDGLLVHGENFQALNLLQARYRGQVQSAYIDPPYNTDASSILYKNNYKNSSWLSLISDRLLLIRNCLASDGILCVAIDDQEVAPLRFVGQQLFASELGVVPVRSNPAGRKSRGQFSPSHEYALFYGNAQAVPGTLEKTERELSRYPLVDEAGERFAWNNLIRHGSGDRREDRPTMFFPIFVHSNDTLRVPEMKWNEDEQAYDVLEDPTDDEIALWPTRVQDGTLVEKRWHRGPDRVRSIPSDYRVRRTVEEDSEQEEIHIDFKIRMDMNAMPKTWWDDKKYASANLGPKMLKDFFGEKKFDFPKAVGLVEDCLRASLSDSHSIVVDFFAGAGTTGQATINLNRADGGRRKYVLVEIGNHFDNVLLPRMKKVVHSPDWKDGKPVSRKGITQLFKYVRLESYEDTMDSLEVTPLAKGQKDLLADNPALAEDYRLRYALGMETSGSASLLGKEFTDPHAYTLSVVRDGVRREVRADLPETFNYLIGLRVKSRRQVDGVLAVTGKDDRGRNCLILWRDLNEMDHLALDAWFKRNRTQFTDSLDVIYVNGDQTLNALKQPGETWIAQSIESAFHERMFEGASDDPV